MLIILFSFFIAKKIFYKRILLGSFSRK